MLALITNGLAKDLYGAGARHLATSAGALLVGDGLMNASDVQNFLGSVLFLTGLAWSALQKYQARQAQVVATKNSLLVPNP